MRTQSQWELSDAGILVPSIPTSGLVIHYTGDNISGTTLVDEQGNSDLSLYNGPAQVAGYNGNAITFDGVNQYGQGSTTESFSAGVTICTRIKFNGSKNSQPIFSKRDGSTGHDMQLSTNSSGQIAFLCWGLNTASAIYTAASFSVGVWYYLEARYDPVAQAVRLRLNDTTQTFARSGTIANTTDGFRIADDWYGNLGAISCDDNLVYNRAVTNEESDIIRGLI